MILYYFNYIFDKFLWKYPKSVLNELYKLHKYYVFNEFEGDKLYIFYKGDIIYIKLLGTYTIEGTIYYDIVKNMKTDEIISYMSEHIVEDYRTFYYINKPHEWVNNLNNLDKLSYTRKMSYGFSMNVLYDTFFNKLDVKYKRKFLIKKI